MRFFGWVAAATLLLVGSAAQAVNYDRLYVFGDSLVDSGNAAIALSSPGVTTTITVPPSGRFTNGLNFADDLSATLGFGVATPFLGGGINYAVGGATATTTGPVPVLPPPAGTDLVPPSFGQQIVNFYEPSVLAGLRPAIDANSLVLVAIGGNDVRAILQGQPLTVGGTVSAVSAGLARLIADGARNIVLVGLPDIGRIPSVYDKGLLAQAAGTQLSQALNLSYAQIAKTLPGSLGVDASIQLFDLYGLQHEIIDNPGNFGINANLLTKSCVDNGGLATNCAGYAFFDGIHPTAQVHAIIASRIAGQLPEPESWMLMIVGFGFTGAAMRRARRLAVA